MTQLSPPADRPLSFLWLGQRGQIILLAIFLVASLAYSACTNLVPDEAYYWVWSRHLSLGYFDHPPMVAYLIRAGTFVLGDSEIGVRWLSIVMAAAMVWILTVAARHLMPNSRAAAFVPVMLLLSPMVWVLGGIVTPDTPACFFQAAALFVVLEIFAPTAERAPRHRARCWIIFGIWMGLALMSKYTSVLFGLAMLLALLSSPQGRAQLRTPWPWLAAVVAFAVFTPVIIWNAQHNLASFRFQLHHGLAGTPPAPGEHLVSAARNLLEYLSGQCLIATPVLFILVIFVLVVHWRRRAADMRVRILVLTATVPLVVFAISSLQRRVEANWPVAAHFPAIILIALYLSENWTRRRIFWAEVAMKVALAAVILVHIPQLVWMIAPNLKTPPRWDDLYGWDQLAMQVFEIARPQRVIRDTSTEPAATQRREHSTTWQPHVFATNYEYASELSFYLPDHPTVWPLPDPARPTVFDFLPGRPNPAELDHAILVRRQVDFTPLAADPRLQPYFTSGVQVIFPVNYRMGNREHRLRTIILNSFSE